MIMIKRVLGCLLATATIAAIVFAVLGRNEFRSLLDSDEGMSQPATNAEQPPLAEPTELRDTTAAVQPTDEVPEL